MKKKIGLGILALLVVVAVYGAIQLMPLLKLLKEVDISEFAPPVIEEDKNVDKTLGEDNELEENELEDNGLEENVDIFSDDNKDGTIPSMDSLQEMSDSQGNSIEKSNKLNAEDNETKKAIAISSDKIANVEKKITLADKAKAVKLVITNLSASDIKTLKDLTSGGLTPEEKAKAIQIAYSKYSDEELKLIKELYRKYVGK